MLHFLIGIAIIVGICAMLANEDVRYMVGQLIKIVLCGAGVIICGIVMIAVIANIHH